jgi:hypothetical protein
MSFRVFPPLTTACLVVVLALPGANTLAHPTGLWAQERISFPTEDGGLIYADLYGEGPRGVVLAHGGRFNKESWRSQAGALKAAGFRALALDFRGYGQ